MPCSVCTYVGAEEVMNEDDDPDGNMEAGVERETRPLFGWGFSWVLGSSLNLHISETSEGVRNDTKIQRA